MALPQYLQDAVDEGRDLNTELASQTPEDIASQQVAMLDQFVSNFILYRLPRAIRAVEAQGGSSISFDIPPDDGTGFFQERIVDPIEAVEGISVIVTEGGSIDKPGYDLVTVTWPGAI